MIVASHVSVSADARNHGNIKLFPIAVQYFNHLKDGIQVRLLDLRSTENETSTTVANLLENVLDEHGIKKKLVAFSAGNTNTNFGGLKRKGNKNVHTLLKKNVNAELLGVGCSAHVLHNSVQHSFDCFHWFDIDALAFKIYQYFSIYTVRTKELEKFCDFVEVTYRDLLYHSKTRWLSLFPFVQRLLQMFQPLKSYFSSQDKPPALLISFFEHDFAEAYLFFVHSLMSVFHENVKEMEKEQNSVLEILKIVDRVAGALRDRIENQFLPFGVKSIIFRLRKDGKDQMCDLFIQQTMTVYEQTEKYLLEWISSLSQFRVIDISYKNCFSFVRLCNIIFSFVPDFPMVRFSTQETSYLELHRQRGHVFIEKRSGL